MRSTQITAGQSPLPASSGERVRVRGSRSVAMGSESAPHPNPLPTAMRRRRGEGTRLLSLVVIGIITLLFAQSVLACSVCYGPANDPMVKGTNNGVWVLLGVVGFVQIGFIALFWSFWRRARALRRFRESLRVIEGGTYR
jgi:hypothetical protein